MEFDAAILAGGRSRRMGQDKANIHLGSKTLLEICVEQAWSWQPRKVLVIGPERPLPGVKFIPDPPVGEPSSLKGVWVSLRAMESPWLLVLGCDMPFVAGELVKLLWQARSAGGSAAWWQGRLQPLPMLLPKDAAGVAEALLRQKRFHLAALQDQLLPGVVAEKQVQAVDPRGLSFFNINTPEDWALARTLCNE